MKNQIYIDFDINSSLSVPSGDLILIILYNYDF